MLKSFSNYSYSWLSMVSSEEELEAIIRFLTQLKVTNTTCRT